MSRGDLGRRRCGQRDRRRASESRSVLSEPRVVGPEIVPPLADTVSLVDGEPRDVQLGNRVAEGLASKALGSHEQEVQLATNRAGQPLFTFTGAQRGIHEACSHAARHEPVDLILHQRDQRAHDQCQPVEHDRGQLVDQRLARPGGHRQQHVPAVEHGLDRLGLPATEALDPELLSQNATDLGATRLNSFGSHAEECSSPRLAVRPGAATQSSQPCRSARHGPQ